MTKLVCCALFDRGLMAFGRPMFVQHINLAMRSLTQEVNNPESELFKAPADYDLYELGEYEDSDGSFALLKVPKMTVTAASLVKQGN